MKIAIIGGGATGLICASYLANHSSFEIDIFECNTRVGKKIMQTGNGRCNFSNLNINKTFYNNESFIDSLLHEDIIAYFSSLGLYSFNDSEGRLYPLSNQAQSILEVLRQSYLNSSRVKERCQCKVEEIIPIQHKYLLKVNNTEEIFDYVIVCIGSRASNPLFDFTLIKKLKLNSKEFTSSLVPLHCNTKGLNGIRLLCNLKMFNDNQLIYQELNGEVQFKDKGISGINILNASFYLNKEDSLKKPYLILEPINKLFDQFHKEFMQRAATLNNEELNKIFYGIFPKMLTLFILEQCNLKNTMLIKQLTTLEIEELINKAFYIRLDIESFYSLNEAQVAKGGVEINEITPSFESKKYPNLFLGGEILDIDGKCGGYNLHFAFLSGLVIAKAIVNK